LGDGGECLEKKMWLLLYTVGYVHFRFTFCAYILVWQIHSNALLHAALQVTPVP